ncbi:hypothetical protein M409DRAFT_57137 [Zasmidium cellare ATCC 36951]|uniref:Uncharacterized protein n=1 Tax=Zasmidium cellare ATCC 36951 TaxID=1080233 RepID=A0A6A6CAK3_ZASCE|nr:uncharacterized protein M409DRAFT_57137 [Zasmidium cellare ATCC 36951]KAF2164045.1 hypothetical protein M409DRAFT_57137 [Zasmidium cellare ATCC 36951]
MVPQGVSGIYGSGRMFDSCNSEPAAAAQGGRKAGKMFGSQSARAVSAGRRIFAEPWFQLQGWRIGAVCTSSQGFRSVAMAAEGGVTDSGHGREHNAMVWMKEREMAGEVRREESVPASAHARQGQMEVLIAGRGEALEKLYRSLQSRGRYRRCGVRDGDSRRGSDKADRHVEFSRHGGGRRWW